MLYREYPPLAALAPFVEKVWTLEGRADPAGPPQPVLPDGRCELVIHFGDPFALVTPAGFERQPSIIFAGQLSSQLLLHPSGHVAIAGIRFHPHGAAGLLRVPQKQLHGPPMPLEDLDTALADRLSVVQDRARDVESAAHEAQRALLGRVSLDWIDPRVAHAVSLIDRARGRVSIERVALSAGVTRRHLENRFLDQVGITPKRLARIARFQHALQLLEDDRAPRPGAYAAAECGYADQAHFIRDFRTLAGCAPGEHLLRKAEMTSFFIASSERRSSRAFPPLR